MRYKLLVAALGFFGAVGSAHAQVGGVKVRVPFQFEIANKTLPAGEYVVWTVRDQVLVRVAGGRTVAMVSSNRIMRQGGKTGRVVFECFTKRCYLSQLWTPDLQTSREILRSKPDIELARNDAQQFVLLGEGGK